MLSGTGWAPSSSRFRWKYWIADSAGLVIKVVTRAIKTIGDVLCFAKSPHEDGQGAALITNTKLLAACLLNRHFSNHWNILFISKP